MMIWLAVAVCLVVVLMLPLGVHVSYGDNGLQFDIKIGTVLVNIYPGKPSPRTKRKQLKSDRDKAKKPTKSRQRPLKEEFTDFLPILQLLYNLLRDFRKRLRVSVLDMKLIIAGNDPCDVAVNYGRAWTAVANLMPLLDQVLTIKYRNVSVECDFLSTETRLMGEIEFTLSFGRILHLLGFHGIKLLVAYINILNKRKDGAKA